MIVRVRGIEVECTLEELDQIIERYGEAAVPGVTGGAVARNGTAGANHDSRLLRAFLEAPNGVQSKTVEGLLQVRGKAIPGALRAWAARVRLAPDGFEKAQTEGKRGWRLTESGLAAARILMGG